MLAAPTYILGINAYHGDVSAVLLRDGELIVALEEERFTRVKHSAGFPAQAIRRCLEAAGIGGADVSHVAISRDPRAHLWRKAAYVLRHRPALDLVRERLRNRGSVNDLSEPLAAALELPTDRLPRLHHVEHHPAHLASAFLVSPFDEAAVAAFDGFGDFVSTSVAAGRGSRVEVLGRVHFPHSLGILYTAVTQHLGFLDYGDEFKVMGLAPYGSPTRVREVEQLIRLLPGGRFELDLRYFRHWKAGAEMTWTEGYPTMGLVYSSSIERLLGPARRPGAEITRDHEDLAASLQAVFERAAFHVLDDLHERTRSPRLCLAGGCAMNSVANGKIRANTPFEEVYVQPAAADNGTALGAAFHIWHDVLGRPRSFVMEHAFWGTQWTDDDVATTVDGWDDREWTYEAHRTGGSDDTCREAAALLADGNVVGWYQGRMEWGARALGNRSILADPRRPDMRDLINQRIKFRERFRPFAPSILEERLDEYFVDAAPDPFMQQVYPIRPDKRDTIPAVTHVDGSGRLQTVGRDENPRYYRLIEEFDRLTGVPVLLNTSFNENEPIVDTPAQALDCFRRTRMDALVIGDVIVRRAPAGGIGPRNGDATSVSSAPAAAE